MTITILPDEATQWISSPSGGRYPRQVVVDFGRPGLRYDIDIRDLIHRTASKLDSGINGEIGNHRAAYALRAIAEALYPPTFDTADNIIEELQDGGCADDFSHVEPAFVRYDPRLMNLRDGLVFVPYLLGGVLWEDGRFPERARNMLETIDVHFPECAFDQFAIRGIRIHALDMIGWLVEEMNRDAMASEGVETWIDELESAHQRAIAAHERYNREWHPSLYAPSGDRKPSVPDELDDMLIELNAMI